MRATVSSGGALLGLGRLPGVVIAQSPADDFAARLRAAGAWLLLDARGTGLCSPHSERLP